MSQVRPAQQVLKVSQVQQVLKELLESPEQLVLRAHKVLQGLKAFKVSQERQAQQVLQVHRVQQDHKVCRESPAPPARQGRKARLVHKAFKV